MELHDVPERLVRLIADDAIGRFLEERARHGRTEEQARAAAVAAAVEGAAADAGSPRRDAAGTIDVVTIDERGRRVPLRSDRPDAADEGGSPP